MLVQPIGPSNTKSPKFLKMAVSYFVDPVCNTKPKKVRIIGKKCALDL